MSAPAVGHGQAGTGRVAGGLPIHRPPATCPVCSDELITLRLGCPSCGTEVSGHFETCRFCRLDASDLTILEVFLRSRGNVRDVQAHLGVSYPTARTRLSEVLDRLGFGALQPTPPAMSGPSSGPPTTDPPSISTVLADLAAGRLSVDQTEQLLRG